MRTAEFLEVYPRDLTSEQIHQGATLPEVQKTQLYSYLMGQLLYDFLSGERDNMPKRMEVMDDYASTVSFKSIEVELLRNEGGWEHRNEVNFYGLNTHMGKMWHPIAHGNGQWPWPTAHTYAAHYSMNGLALEGLEYFDFYDKQTRKRGVHPSLDPDPESQAVTKRLNGALQEIDAAIIVLNWAKRHPNLTVVPAPAQFEHSSTGANADLLVIDLNADKVVGVQVKSHVDEKTRKRYDPDRIVVLGSEDIGNMVLKAPGRKGTEVLKPYPGIVAASRAHGIQTLNNKDVSEEFIPYLRAKKMQAATLLGRTRVDYNRVSVSIGSKILEKL